MKCKNITCKQPIDHDRRYPGSTILIPYCTIHISEIYAKKAKKERQQKEKIKYKEMKERVGGRKSEKSILQTEINKLARMIDHGHKCTSCGKGQLMYGGHYHTVGANGNIRYNLLNIWNQCYSCNGVLSANKIEYKANLIELLGNEVAELITERLPSLYPVEHLKKFDLKEKLKLVRWLIRNYEPKFLTPSERLNKRIEFNQLIGIY